MPRWGGQGAVQGRLFIKALSGIQITLDAFSSPSQAIYEMSRGEQDLIEDLKLARKVSGDFSCRHSRE